MLFMLTILYLSMFAYYALVTYHRRLQKAGMLFMEPNCFCAMHCSTTNMPTICVRPN